MKNTINQALWFSEKPPAGGSKDPKNPNPPRKIIPPKVTYAGEKYTFEAAKKAAIDSIMEKIAKQRESYKSLQFKDFHYAKIVKQYIIGQDEAIDKLVYIVYHNVHENMMADFIGVDSPRYSALVVGPSGCGKTATLTKIAELFHVPFVKYNATPLTSSGYVGKSVEDMITLLIEEAGGDLERAERGILYIDEIDKKVSSSINNSSNRDVNGTSVQEELLKFLEPSIIDLGKGKTFDTRYLTVLMSGRFIGIDKIREKRLRGESSIGFMAKKEDAPIEVPKDAEEDDFNEFEFSDSTSFTHQDIIDFGFLDEFVGRIFDVVEFRKLSRQDLVDVILAKDSSLQRFLEEIKTKNQELYIDPEVFERIADAAYNSPMGARCIDSIINNFLIPAKKDFMHNYRPGVMEYDADGNYESMFEAATDSNFMIYRSEDGPRKKRRKALGSEE